MSLNTPFFELSRDAMCLLDEQNYILAINKTMRNQLGIDEKELLGSKYTGLLVEGEQLEQITKVFEYARKQPQDTTSYLHFLYTKAKNELGLEAMIQADEAGKIYITGFFIGTDQFESLEERIQHLEAIKEVSEMRRKYLDVVLATVPDGVIVVDQRGCIRSLNPAAELMFGYRDIEVFDKPANVLLAEQPVPELIGKIAMYQNEESKTLHNVQLIAKRKNATYFPIAVSISETKFEDGRRVFVALVRDLSHEQEIKDKLQDSHNFRESIFNAAKIGLAVIDEWGYFVKVNEQYALMTGYTAEELIGKVYLLIVPDFEYEEAIKTIKKARRGITEAKPHWKLKQKDGTLIDIELDINDFYDRKNRRFFILSSKDITEEKAVQADLVRTKKLLESIFSSLDNVFWSYDIKEDKLFTVSSSIEDLYGVSIQEIEQDPDVWLKAVHPDDLELVQKSRQLARLGNDVSYEYRIIDPNNKVHWIQTDVKVVRNHLNEPIRIDGLDTDITQRVLANQELDSTKRMLQLILDALPNGVIFTNTDLEIEWLNKKAADMLEVEEEECVGDKISNFFVKESFFLISENLGEQRETSIFGITFKNKFNEHIPTETISTLVRSVQLETIGFLYVISDISEKIQIEKEKERITRSLMQFKRTLDVTKDGVFMFDEQVHKLIYANKGASEATGYLFEELMSMKFTQLLSDTPEKDFEQLLVYVVNDLNHQLTLETHFAHKSGAKYPAEVVLQYVKFEGGDSRFIAIVRDISERVASSEMLKESELKFRSTFEQARIGIAHLAFDLSWVAFNAYFCNMTGYDARELSIRKLREITHPKDLPRDIAYLRQVLARERDGYNMRTRYIHKNGNVIWVNLSLSLVKNDEDEPAFIVMFVENISDQVEAEEKLKNTLEELKVRNFELDRFVYSAGHDLRSPITSSLGLISLMESDPENKSDNLRKLYGRLIKLDDYVKSIIHHSEVVHLDAKFTPVCLERLILENINDLEYLPNAESVKFRINVQRGTAIYADEKSINIILRCLLSNAIKFADPYKDDPMVIIRVQATTTHFSITISDNGIGIDEELQPKIFDMFVRCNDVAEGNGLGLYILRLIVEKLKGTIKFTSKLGVGTTFQVVLPNHVEE